MDQMVLETQKWLNKNYAGKNGYKTIAEDGVTGWGTMKALVTALQIEIGISGPNGNFGPATTAAFQPLSIESTKINQIYILQGGLFCKGYNPGGFTGTFGNGTQEAIKKLQNDSGILITGTVDALLMKSILSMDAFTLLNYGEYHGDENIRTIQKYLNKNYSSNKYFAADIGLVPCDGIYGRMTNKALLYAFQIEEGISVPNGVFGPSTSSLAPVISVGSSKSKFIYLLQFALYCNNFDPNGFDGQFGNGAKTAVINFQKFSALSADGIVGMQTWASLLVSTGDKNRKGTMCDCATTVTDAKAKTIKNNGYISVGRYLTGKFKMTQQEINTILANGLRIFPILETGGYQLSYFNSYQGNLDAKGAIKAAHEFGFDSNTIIYFTVDFDALDSDITNAILPYFSEIYGVFRRTGTKYKIGIYGPRNVCSRVAEAGYSCSSFVCDMSSGFSGNLGYPLPKDWAIDQISTITIGTGNGQIEIDNNISSGRDLGVSFVNQGNNSNGVEDTQKPPIPPNTIPDIPFGYDGREHIIISGFEYDDDRYKYNFIETALKKLSSLSKWRKDLPINSKFLKDKITWIIDTTSYSDIQFNKFTSALELIDDLKFVLVKNSHELVNYINTGNRNGSGVRTMKISEIEWFGHGYPDGSELIHPHKYPFLALGQNFKSDESNRFELSDIMKLSPDSFDNCKTIFYTCNTGTGEENSFAYKWKSIVGGEVQACVNKTSYTTIMYKEYPNYSLSESIRVKNARMPLGYCKYGSDRYPIPGENAYWIYLR